MTTTKQTTNLSRKAIVLELRKVAILSTLTANHGRVVSCKTLARVIYGNDELPSSWYVQVTKIVSILRNEFAQEGKTIGSIYGRGYILGKAKFTKANQKAAFSQKVAGLNVPQQKMLDLLLMRRGEVVSHMDLVTAAWGDNPPMCAYSALTRNIFLLKKAITSLKWKLVSIRNDGYVLGIAPAPLRKIKLEGLFPD